MRPLIVFVDVDDTLIRSFGSKRIPITHVVDHVRELASEGAKLYCWSSGGAEYARTSARELGIEDLFEGFLPKPNVMIDDVKPKDWRTLTMSHPATVRGATYSNYREQVFPEDVGIALLPAVDHIRKRPGMYVGDVGELGLHHLALWLLRDSFSPLAVEAKPRSVRACLLAPNHLEVSDDRRHSAISKEKFRVMAEQLLVPSSHPYGDFVVVNALSQRFELELWFEGQGWTAEYRRGKLERGPFATSGLPGSGTRIRFVPDPEILSSVDFNVEQLAGRLDELAALNAGIAVQFEEPEGSKSWLRPAGLEDWVAKWEPSAADGVRVFHGVLAAGEITCEVAWRWADEGRREPIVRSWVNTVETHDGGSHTKAFLRNVRSQKEGEGKVLLGAVHVTMPHPRFKSPIKSELDVPEIGEFVKATVQAARLEPPS